MVDIVNNFESSLVSYDDVREQHPNWSDVAIEDYMARLRDVVRLADETNEINANVGAVFTGPGLQAQLNVINQRLGSGDPLTCDDTGFTCDNTHLTCDRTEY